MDEYKGLWARMVEVRCQYCKYFMGRGIPLNRQCTQWGLGLLSPHSLKTQECPVYEWETRLTKEDFADYE